MTTRTTATIGEILHRAASRLDEVGIEDARLEAEVLLATGMGTDRAQLLAHLRDEIDGSREERLAVLVARRLLREPLAYITGRREFYGINISCDRRALVPRPETELLVDFALEHLAGDPSARVADVGTGTGAIAIAIARHAPAASIVATDSSPDALTLARENMCRTGVDGRIDVRHADLMSGMGMFDVIAANLPYIPDDEWHRLAPEIRDHEPRTALTAGPKGTEVIERLLRSAPGNLAAGGSVAVEIGIDQGDDLLDIAESVFPGGRVFLRRDLAGIDRLLVVDT